MFFLRVGRGGKFCFLCVFSICFRHLRNSSIGWRRSTTSPQKGHQGGHAEGSPFFHNTSTLPDTPTPVAVLDTDRQLRRIASLPIDRNTAPVVSKYVSGIRRTDVHRCVPRRAIDRRLTLTTSRRINFHAVATGLTFVLTLTE